MVTGKPPRKLWKIGELARHTGLSRQTIHNYVVLGLITEEDRTDGNHRLFGDDVWKQLAAIERLKAEGKTLAEITRRMTQKRARER